MVAFVHGIRVIEALSGAVIDLLGPIVASSPVGMAGEYETYVHTMDAGAGAAFELRAGDDSALFVIDGDDLILPGQTFDLAQVNFVARLRAVSPTGGYTDFSHLVMIAGAVPPGFGKLDFSDSSQSALS